MAATLVAVAVIASAPRSVAQTPPHARLTYSHGPGTERCPSEEVMRADVIGRLGYDPFRPDARIEVVATISRAGRGLRAEVQLRDENGRQTGTRQIASAGDDCRELATALALAISIAVDPLSLTRAAPEHIEAVAAEAAAESNGPVRDAPASASEPRVGIMVVGMSRDTQTARSSFEPTPTPPGVAPRVEAGPWVPFVGISGHVSWGFAPVFLLGGTASFGMRRDTYSVALELRADAPGIMPFRTGYLSFVPVVASFVPCGHYRVVALCAVVTAGALSGSGVGFREVATKVAPLVYLGLRPSVELPLFGNLEFTIRLDFQVLVVGGDFEVIENGASTHVTSQPVALTTAVGFQMHF